MSLPLYVFRGPHAEIGRQHGETLKEPIAAFARRRLERCRELAAEAGAAVSEREILALAAHHRAPLARFTPELFEELEGLAEGSGVPLDALIVLNGYTDFKDTLLRAVAQRAEPAAPAAPEAHECTAFYSAAEASREGRVFLGQTWDMDGEAEKYVVGLRLEAPGEPACIVLTHAGGLALAGLNQAGVGVVINNLLPRDARVGVPWPFLVRSALACRDFDNAFLALTQVPFASGHNYLLSDDEGRAVNVETTGEECEVLSVDTPVYAHANHYTCASLQALAAPMLPGNTSCRREERLRQLLEERKGALEVASLQACLADPEVEVAPPGVSSRPGDPPHWSCATALFDLGARTAFLRAGPPSGGPLQPVDFQTHY